MSRRDLSQEELPLGVASLRLELLLRCDVVLAHVAEQLARYFIKNGFGEHVWVVFKLLKGHKLNNVGRHVLVKGVRVQRFLVAVEHLHAAEVRIADAHDDDGKR